MISLQDYLAMDASAMAEGVRKAEFTPRELLDCAIEQAQKLNPQLNAINTACYEQASALLEALPSDTVMGGLPFLIKDLSDLKDTPTRKGSALFADFVPNQSAAIVERFLQAGMIPIGKSNTPEFGLTITTEPVATGLTRNPWNLHHSTGGSSGGAAAAVAAGIVPVAHATDGGGSIRIPASCCGLVGLKPSRGLTVIEPGLAESWSGMSVGHVLSRSVRDSARFLEFIALNRPLLYPMPSGPRNFSALFSQAPKPLRIAVQATHPFKEAIDPECLDAVHSAARLCESLGHAITELDSRPDYRAAAKAMNSLIALHTFQAVNARIHALGLELDSAPMETSTRQMALYGASLGIDDYTQAIESLHRVGREMDALHTRHDIVLSPVLAKTPAALGWLDMNSEDTPEYVSRYKSYGGFTAMHNGTGQPAIAVPMSRSGNGLPVGVMFSAAWGGDLSLLQLAAQIELAQPWPQLAPLAAA